MSSNDNSRPRANKLLIDGDLVEVIRKRGFYKELITGEFS